MLGKALYSAVTFLVLVLHLSLLPRALAGVEGDPELLRLVANAIKAN